MNELAGALTPYFENLVQQNQFSGVVRITQGQTPLYNGAFGYASRAWQIPNHPEIRFDTASITKLFTAVAVLQMIERGLLDFHTRAVEFLGLKDTTISPEVTVFHLLTHSSGIGDDCDEEAGENYEDLWKVKPNYSVTVTEDFLPQFMHKAPNFAPGQGCRYCNCSFVLLGLMVEKAAGMSYREYVRQSIFEKAGMAQSDFCRMDRVHANAAEGSDPLFDEQNQLIGWKKNIYSYPPVGSPDSGAYVTASDLDRFLRQVQAGTLLSAALTRDFLTPQVFHRQEDEWTVKFGYGLEFFLNPAGDVVFYQKDGINAGVSGIIRHYPARNLNVVILSNMMEGVWSPIWKIHELVG